jgi:hypothetical protein
MVNGLALRISSPVIKPTGLLGDGVTNRISSLLKREFIRRVPNDILTVLSKFKFEFLIAEGTPFARTKTIDSFDPTLPDIKPLSYVKGPIDHTPIGGRIQTDIVAFGIEDLDVPAMADDWKDLIISARYWYNAEGTAPESILISVDGAYTHAKIYYEGVLEFESVWDAAVNAFHTHYRKSIPLPLP